MLATVDVMGGRRHPRCRRHVTLSWRGTDPLEAHPFKPPLSLRKLLCIPCRSQPTVAARERAACGSTVRLQPLAWNAARPAGRSWRGHRRPRDPPSGESPRVLVGRATSAGLTPRRHLRLPALYCRRRPRRGSPRPWMLNSRRPPGAPCGTASCQSSLTWARCCSRHRRQRRQRPHRREASRHAPSGRGDAAAAAGAPACCAAASGGWPCTHAPAGKRWAKLRIPASALRRSPCPLAVPRPACAGPAGWRRTCGWQAGSSTAAASTARRWRLWLTTCSA